LKPSKQNEETGKKANTTFFSGTKSDNKSTK